MVAVLLLCWGSFLNVVAHRLVTEKNFFGARSRCPHCNHIIAWYDNIPVISYLVLRGSCRTCKRHISLLYPFIEILTTLSLLTLAFLPPTTHFAYFILFSALIVSIRSDIETMLISRFVTLFLIPLGVLFAWSGLLPITVVDSIAGALLGYGFLYTVSKIFFWLTGKEGIGQGDLELLAFIGSFVGFVGCWVTLFIGAIIGSIVGTLYITLSGSSRAIKIPFGPFLAFGAMMYILFQEKLLTLMLGL